MYKIREQWTFQVGFRFFVHNTSPAYSKVTIFYFIIIYFYFYFIIFFLIFLIFLFHFISFYFIFNFIFNFLFYFFIFYFYFYLILFFIFIFIFYFYFYFLFLFYLFFRYVLLFKDLLQNTPSDHRDLSSLCNVLEKISNTTTALNESKRKTISLKKMMNISQLITNSLKDEKKSTTILNNVKNFYNLKKI